MREAGLFRAVAILAALAFAASCGSDTADDDDAATAGQRAPAGALTAGLTGHVVAGDEAGWVVDQDGVVWRIGLDGDATPTEAEIPTYNSGFSTFFDGVVVFGGTRCDGTVQGEGCEGETVVEMRLLRESDATVETVELRREDGGQYRTIGAGVLGVADGEGWIYRDTGELSTVDAEGTVTEMSIPSGAASGRTECMVDGELYGLRDTSAPPESPESEGGPAPTVYEPGTQATQGWVVDQWDGTAWVELANGAYTTEGPDVSVTCTAQGYVVHPYGIQNPLADWTPENGWRTTAPTLSSLDLSSMATTTTNSLYTVTDGTVQRLDFAAGRLTNTGIIDASFDAQADSPEPAVDIVDDAGTLLIACTSDADRGTASCVVTPDG